MWNYYEKNVFTVPFFVHFFFVFYAPLLLPIQSIQLQYKPTIIIIFIPFSISQQHENLLKYFNLL